MRFFAATLLLTAACAQDRGYWESFEVDTTEKSHSKFLSDKSMHDDIIDEIMADINESQFGRALQGSASQQIINMLKQSTKSMTPDQRREFLVDFQKKFDEQMVEQEKQLAAAGLPASALKQAQAQMKTDVTQVNAYINAVLGNPGATQRLEQHDASYVTAAPSGSGAKASSVSSWYENGDNGSAIKGFNQRVTPSEKVDGSIIQTWLELFAASDDNSKNVYVISNMKFGGQDLGSGAGCGDIKDMAMKGYKSVNKKLSKAGCSLKAGGKIKKEGDTFASLVNFGVVDPVRYANSPALKNNFVLKAGTTLKTRHGFNWYKDGSGNAELLDSWDSKGYSTVLDAAYALQTVVATTVAAVVLTQF